MLKSVFLIFFRGPCFEAPVAILLKRIRHVSAEDPIPHHKEWLRKVILVAIELVVDIVIRGVVSKEKVEEIAG